MCIHWCFHTHATPGPPGKQLRTISDDAAVVADSWNQRFNAKRIARWDLPKVVKHFRVRARRLEAAFYFVNVDESLTLWGLVVGRFSRARVTASMHFIARGPASDICPFAVAATRYLQLHAQALGCTTIAVTRPLR